MTLRDIVKQLESCDFQCIAGALTNNIAFIALKEASEHSTEEMNELFNEAYSIAVIKDRVHRQ